MIVPISILSQTTTNSDSRDITYERLNEFAKLIEYKRQSDTLFTQYKLELALKDSLLLNRKLTLEQYELEIIPGYERRIQIKDSTISTQKQIFSLKEDFYTEEIKQQKNKKWTWLGGGALFGLLMGIVFGG